MILHERTDNMYIQQDTGDYFYLVYKETKRKTKRDRRPSVSSVTSRFEENGAMPVPNSQLEGRVELRRSILG